MKITQIKPMADHMLLYRTAETGDHKYFYSTHKAKDYTEVYTWGDDEIFWYGKGITRPTNTEAYKHYILRSYIPINQENPEATIHTFWKLYMLQ